MESDRSSKPTLHEGLSVKKKNKNTNSSTHKVRRNKTVREIFVSTLAWGQVWPTRGISDPGKD
jgi:hypothetical protein